MNEEIILPDLNNSSNIYVTLKDNSPQANGIFYDMIKILYKQPYEIIPVYDNNEFTSLGQIKLKYELKNINYLEINNLLLDHDNLNDGLKPPFIVKDKNIYFKKLSYNNNIEFSFNKTGINGITIICNAKDLNEKIEKLLDIEINGSHYYLNNVIDIFNKGNNKDNYFPERKIFNREYSIIKKEVFFDKTTTDKIKIRYLSDKGSINIYAIGLNY
jgi:hypothetical protein